MWGFILKIFTGGALDRVLSTVDKKISAETDREKIKGDIIRESYRNRGAWMLTLMMLFTLPLAFWFGSVVIYSVFWCADCAYPQTWTIAALPPPLDQWSGMIIISIFGVVGVSKFKR